MRSSLNEQALIYLQIAQMLEDDILRHVYSPGDQVPSTNELAKAFNINPATAAKGINLLVADGILYKKRGLGMFVTDDAPAIALNKRKDAFAKAFIAPMAREARFLGLSPADIMTMVQEAMERGEE